MIRLALIASVVLYVFIGEVAGRNITATPNSNLYFAVALCAVITVGTIMVLRRVLVVPSETALTKQPGDPTALARWRTGYVITYALSEAVALFGLVLRIVGFTLSQVATFYAVGLILLMFFAPRRPSNTIG